MLGGQMEFCLLFQSVMMHIFTAVFLLIYIPISLMVRILRWVFLRPFKKEDMRGKVVLITGASSGIGEELAYQYAKRGAYLALVARREQALKGVARTARDRGAPDVLALPADISDPNESKRVVEETVAHYGKLNHLVANAGVWSICFFEEITNITAFTKLMDVNFWGSVYPTYYALPYLKASRGRIIVTSSVAGTVATSKISFYNATKAALLRFYETLRTEFGSEVGITIMTPGYVESEMTKGKAIQKDGKIAVDIEARDVQIGLFPIGRAETLAEVAMDSICKGDWYLTWPSWYRPLQMIARLAPEVINWVSRSLYISKQGSQPLSKRILEATGAKKLMPASLRHPHFKTETNNGDSTTSMV